MQNMNLLQNQYYTTYITYITIKTFWRHFCQLLQSISGPRQVVALRSGARRSLEYLGQARPIIPQRSGNLAARVVGKLLGKPAISHQSQQNTLVWATVSFGSNLSVYRSWSAFLPRFSDISQKVLTKQVGRGPPETFFKISYILYI